MPTTTPRLAPCTAAATNQSLLSCCSLLGSIWGQALKTCLCRQRQRAHFCPPSLVCSRRAVPRRIDWLQAAQLGAAARPVASRGRRPARRKLEKHDTARHHTPGDLAACLDCTQEHEQAASCCVDHIREQGSARSLGGGWARRGGFRPGQLHTSNANVNAHVWTQRTDRQQYNLCVQAGKLFVAEACMSGNSRRVLMLGECCVFAQPSHSLLTSRALTVTTAGFWGVCRGGGATFQAPTPPALHLPATLTPPRRTWPLDQNVTVTDRQRQTPNSPAAAGSHGIRNTRNTRMTPAEDAGAPHAGQRQRPPHKSRGRRTAAMQPGRHRSHHEPVVACSPGRGLRNAHCSAGRPRAARAGGRTGRGSARG